MITKVGFEQLQPKRKNTHSDAEHAEAKEMEDISFSPLAMPLLAGPGAIASVIGVSSTFSMGLANWLVASLGIFVTCTSCWVLLRESHWIMKLLGVNGANALTKVMGFLLLCIGVQLVMDGATDVFLER